MKNNSKQTDQTVRVETISMITKLLKTRAEKDRIYLWKLGVKTSRPFFPSGL